MPPPGKEQLDKLVSSFLRQLFSVLTVVPIPKFSVSTVPVSLDLSPPDSPDNLSEANSELNTRG